MRALRGIAIVLLACFGVAGATAAVLWGAGLAGLARTEVVTTAAMEPEYAAGDLVIVTPVGAADVREGDVVSVRAPGASTGRLERVVAVDAASASRWLLTTVASSAAEPSKHEVGTQTWAPSLRVPLVGGVAAAMVEPGYAIPGIAIVLLLAAIALVGRAPAVPARSAA